MNFLLDTNIIARIAQPDHPMHAVALGATTTLLTQGHTLLLGSQSLYEFWVVATRPVANNSGLGLTTRAVEAHLVRLRNEFQILHDGPAVLDMWAKLVLRHDIKGKRAHDTRLAAVMITNKIADILTFNVADFKLYPEIVVHEPQTLMSQQP
jgi:predicted nucleic acid-binding protein